MNTPRTNHPIPETVLYRRIEWPAEFSPGRYVIERGDDWLRLHLTDPMSALELAAVVRRIRTGRVRRVA